MSEEARSHKAKGGSGVQQGKRHQWKDHARGAGRGGREGATGQIALLGTVPPAAGAQALKSDRRSDQGSLSLRLREVGQQRPPLVT